MHQRGWQCEEFRDRSGVRCGGEFEFAGESCAHPVCIMRMPSAMALREVLRSAWRIILRARSPSQVANSLRSEQFGNAWWRLRREGLSSHRFRRTLGKAIAEAIRRCIQTGCAQIFSCELEFAAASYGASIAARSSAWSPLAWCNLPKHHFPRSWPIFHGHAGLTTLKQSVVGPSRYDPKRFCDSVLMWTRPPSPKPRPRASPRVDAVSRVSGYVLQLSYNLCTFP